MSFVVVLLIYIICCLIACNIVATIEWSSTDDGVKRKRTHFDR